MNIEKINQIVQRKNEQLEQDAVYQAEELINVILKSKNQIRDIEKTIKEAQEKLATLEAKQITSEEIL